MPLAPVIPPHIRRVSGKTRLFRIRFGEGSESLTLGKAAVLQQTTGTVGGNRILDQLANKKTTGLSDAELVSLDAGEFLFREGDAADALYIVQKGTLRVVSGSTVYETLKPGGIVGEMALVDQSSRRSASVIAGTRAELLKIDRKQFLDLVATNPGFSIEVMQVMARRLRVMNRRYSNRS